MTFRQSSSQKSDGMFALYSRTGYRAALGVELKFNPWHDVENGRFTFVGQGRYYPSGYVGQEVSQRDREDGARAVRDIYGSQRRPSVRDSYVPDRSHLDPKHPKNWTVYVVRQGDTLSRIAQHRRGLTAADLAWLNDIPIDKPLRVSQRIRLPTQRSLDDGRDARNKAMALALYMETHGGRMPPNPAKPPSVAEQISATYRRIFANGYLYELDFIDRFKRVTGTLTQNRAQGRAPKTQKLAGVPDRLPKDHGGHVIARRFNGPKEWFNHFAQDSSFNRGAYAKLENSWDRAMNIGHK